ncbi:MAG: barstar family protein [Clostridia bacterium]
MGKLTERLLDPSRSGVYRASRTEEIEDALQGTDLRLSRISLAGARDKHALMDALSLALGFPDWFGRNWDALEDCLADLSWRPAQGHVLVLERFDALAKDDLGILTDVLRSSAESWAGRGRSFFAVFVDPGRSTGLQDLFREQ